MGVDFIRKRKKISRQAAFHPHRHIDRAKARMVMNLSANDYFFWLGDAVEDYQRPPVEKRLCISPNFNHSDVRFSAEEPLAV